MNSSADTTIAQRPFAVLGWAAFLAISWTWCIGMFLPVLLIRDYGSWSWVVFAIPNVVGAAAMGWVLVRPGSSEKMVAEHTAAMTAFSVVTILFHVLFVGWIVRWLGDWAMVGLAGGVALIFFPLLLNRTAARVAAALVWVGSLSAFIFSATQLGRIPVTPADSNYLALWPLAAVCLLGFVLCPYLDLTFHRARQSVSSYGSVAAFTLGFGVFFLAMIVFTLWYAPLLSSAGNSRPTEVSSIILLVIAAHMAGQSGYTVSAHLVEVVRRCRDAQGAARPGALVGLLYGACILAVAYFVTEQRGYGSMSGGELGYRLFMAFYGLISPAYVWTVLIPWRQQVSTVKQRWVVLLLVLILAAPAFWVGFIERDMMWLLAGIAAVGLGRPILEWGIRPRFKRAVPA